MNCRLLVTLMLALPLSVVIAQPPTTPSAKSIAPVSSRQWAGPDTEFGQLFADVQLKAVFPDSKTFADCTPQFPAASIRASYEKSRVRSGFDLKAFVLKNFTLPTKPASGYTSKADQTA